MSKSVDRHDVAALLDDFHQRAADSDLGGYFACFAPEGRFLGTDATENWDVEEFERYAAPPFKAGRGWQYVPNKPSRVLNIVSDGALVCFDE